MLALDTNVLVAFQTRHPNVVASYQRALGNSIVIAIPSLVRYEARRELAQPLYERRLSRLDALLAAHPTLEFDALAADFAVTLFEQLRGRGELIEHPDLLIAATAIRHGASLVTHNVKHFSRIPGLLLQDWQAE